MYDMKLGFDVQWSAYPRLVLQWSRCVLKSPWLCRLGDASYVMCTALYMMVLYNRARVGPTTKTSDEISIICLFRLILQANLLFCFELWYSSCFRDKCWFHTNPKRCSHTTMWILILLDNWDCHVNPFQPTYFSSSGSDHFQHPQDQLSFRQRCLFHPSPSCLCFPALPPLLLPGVWVSFDYQLHSRGASLVFRQLFQPVNSLLFDILHLFFFSGGFNSSFSGWSYSFPWIKCFPCSFASR